MIGLAVWSQGTIFGLAGPILIVVLALSGYFTLRSNVARVWRENYEAEKARADDADERAAEQRELKHAALTELAAWKMRTDVTSVLAAISDLGERLAAHDARLSELEAAVLKMEKRIVMKLDAIRKSE